ncbi:MAG: site-specific integrase, partial [Bacteroidetes bacterium]|nr:site-specific integrase [Bacteroidota bacterium]
YYHNQKFLEKAKAGIFSIKTHQRFEITKNKVLDFMKEVYKVSDMPLEKVKFAFATELEHFLTVNKGIQPNTAMKYIKNIKKIMNMAVNLEWIPTNPLNGFKCTYVNPDREILTPIELDLMYQKEFISKRLEDVRDVYVFCCYTGYAYAEVEKLKIDDVCIGIDGERWIRTNRNKTDGKENIMLLPIALQIIEKHKQHPLCKAKNKLLPVITNQKFNEYLAEIATLYGIKKHLTSHTARHTFATSVTLTNGVPIETVSEMLGHKDIRTTQIYAKIVQQKLSTDMKALREKLHPTISEKFQTHS